MQNPMPTTGEDVLPDSSIPPNKVHPQSYWHTVKARLREFGFAWFTVNMACGIIPTLFVHFIVGGSSRPIKIIALILWLLNFALFLLFCFLTIARYAVHPSSWQITLQHPIQILYIAAFPMGFATIINGAISVIHTSWGFGGRKFVYAAWSCWWIDTAISFFLTFWITHRMITRLEYNMDSMSSAWMFPVVTLTVTSSVGSIISSALQPIAPSHAWLTTIISAIMLLIGLSFALMYNAMFFQRLIVTGLPTGLHIMSAFFPLGPLGQSGYSFLLLAQGFEAQLPLDHGNSQFLRSDFSGPMLYTVCLSAGFVMWAMSTAWIVFAFMGIAHTIRREKVGFGPTYWGLIFPNGVYAAFNFQLGNMMDSEAFRVWGAIYACGTFAMWLYIVTRVCIEQVRFEIQHFRLHRGRTRYSSPEKLPSSFSGRQSVESTVGKDRV